ncbi:MAG: PIN domain-containing protein [Spirochaetaceae bacterium]|jgi:tRNA(fMet)-specific endonuclease VapC|nr:PIN domain-containing protein [Spirochaetaceae bacterium]
MTYYLDANICIYFLKGKNKILKDKILSMNPNEIKIPSIVRAELLYGVEKSQRIEENREKVLQFLFPIETIAFNEPEADIYSKIRVQLEKNRNIIGPNDLIIASTVLANDGILITNNVKEFNRVDKLQIEDWTAS